MALTKLKALGTNSNSRAELNDIYGPTIYDSIKHENGLYSILPTVKVDGDRMGFRVKTAVNPTADSYEELDVIATGNTTRQRHYFPIKLVKVAVEVSGLMKEAAKGPGGVGNIWAEELKDATLDLADELDKQVVGAAVPTTSNDISGLQYLIDDGNTYTTYGDVTDRTATGYEWAAANINDTAEDLSLSRMRTMIRTCVEDGAKRNNLFFATADTQVDKFKNLIQNLQRTVPTSSRVGFEGVPSLDGIPIMSDLNIASGELYCLDRSTLKLGVLKPPTIINLPEPKDAEAAAIVTYQQLICTMPKVNYKKTALTT